MMTIKTRKDFSSNLRLCAPLAYIGQKSGLSQNYAAALAAAVEN
jgi:hypothetical protein